LTKPSVPPQSISRRSVLLVIYSTFAVLPSEQVKSPGTAPHGVFSPKDSPELQLFRTNDSLPDFNAIEGALTAGGKDYRVKGFMEGPPFDHKSPVWKVDYEEGQKRGIFDSVFGLFRDDDTAMGKRRK
jgi:hypothetical protein